MVVRLMGDAFLDAFAFIVDLGDHVRRVLGMRLLCEAKILVGCAFATLLGGMQIVVSTMLCVFFGTPQLACCRR